MSDKVAEPISYIMNSEIGGVLSKAFAELYRKKPNFPVTYLATWLKDYSHSQQSKKDQTQNLKKNIEEYRRLEQQTKIQAIHETEKKLQLDQKLGNEQKQYNHTIESTEFLEDLLKKWLPNYIEKKYQLSGAYVGSLTHPFKKVDPTNFDVGAQLDTEIPKIIQYIGTSDSQQKTMHMKILPSQHGVSFDCFNEPEPQPQEAEPVEGEEAKPPKEPKKTYIFVPDVTKSEKMHFFKFPKLGSYACFPLKLKSILTQSSFDQGVVDYKQYIKQKQQSEKQYHDKINELRTQADETKKKYDQFQLPQQDPSPEQQAQKKNLQQQAHKAEQALVQLQNNPPKVPQPNFNSVQRNYLLGCDTLGQDKQMSAQVLDQIDKKIALFKRSFEQKERSMLLHDIHAFIEQQSKLESIQNIYKQHEKNAAGQSEQQAKQKGLKDKQLELEIAATKAKKMDSIFQDPLIQKSMKTYFGYSTPKYKEVIQIALMLLGYKREEINQSRKNTLDFRKIKNPNFVQQFIKKLNNFDLKPESAGACSQEYKINKLLERLQKIDLEQVSKYNGFIWVLVNHLKNYCWALILCRDAKKQSYEQSLKAKQDRDAQIEKYKDDRQKAMDTAKAELGQQNQQNFNEQQWINNYIVENPEPQPLEVIKLQEYLNID